MLSNNLQHFFFFETTFGKAIQFDQLGQYPIDFIF